MVALSFIHAKDRDPSFHLEAQQKATIAMIGLTLGRFVTILFYGDLVAKYSKKAQDTLKYLVCFINLTFAIIIFHSNVDHYNPWWFFMSLVWGIQDGVLDYYYFYRLGDDTSLEEKDKIKTAYTTIMVISGFIIFLVSIGLYNKTPIFLLLFMIIALFGSLFFCCEIKKTTAAEKSAGDSGRMLILPEEEKKLIEKEKETAMPEPAAEQKKVEQDQPFDRPPEVASVKLD